MVWRMWPSRWLLWTGATGTVDGDLVEVGSAQADELGVRVREEPALEQRIVGEVDAGHEVPGVEGDLLRLGEEVVGVAVEGELADALHGHELLGDELGRIEQIEVEGILVLLLDDLHAELPLREIAVLDGFPQVAPLKVRILPGDLERLVPHHRVHAEEGLPVELDEARLASGR